MTIRDYISRAFPWVKRDTAILKSGNYSGFEGITAFPFGELIFRNCVELLTDLCNDVTWANLTNPNKKGDTLMTFARFSKLYSDDAATILWRVFRYGFAVIGLHKETGEMRLLDSTEWREYNDGKNNTVLEAYDPALACYVMKSPIYREEAKSDYGICYPFIKFLDNTLNASNTACAKLGAFVVASPETAGTAPTPAVLNPTDKEDMEEELAKEYGLLNKQRQIMLLPRGMKFETIKLTDIDTKMVERVKLCVCAIADRVKVPANQVAIIDAASSKTLANGTELREGDTNKYQSFERLLNRTFAKFAEDLGLKVDYTIYNKPQRPAQQ